ncbi:MAG: hypothetical protein M3Y24_11200 [Acidobacteriota bacterium]|nr:hypothetical protein [Acidobacteriota bacterium]
MTGSAKQGKSADEFGVFKAAFRLSLAMTGAQDQVMSGQFDLGTLA